VIFSYINYTAFLLVCQGINNKKIGLFKAYPKLLVFGYAITA